MEVIGLRKELQPEEADLEKQRALASKPLAFASSTGQLTDWKSIDSVDPKLALELDSLGVKNVEQLQELTPEQREIFTAKLASKGQSWDWSWLANWKTAAGAAGLGAAGAVATSLFDKKDSPQFDWSVVKGLDPKAGKVLAAMGIDSPDQLEQLSAADRDVLDAKLAYEGAKFDWNDLGGLKTAHAAATDAASAAAASSGAAVAGAGAGVAAGVAGFTNSRFGSSVAGAKDWSTAGVEPEVANELSELGIANVGELENLSGSERERIESHMKKKGIAWDWSKLAGWKSKLAAGTLGSVAGVVAGAKAWSSAGVEPEVANELSELGIANVGDLDNLSGSERERIESHMKKKGIAWDWSKLAGWKSKLAAGTLGSVAGVVAGA